MRVSNQSGVSPVIRNLLRNAMAENGTQDSKMRLPEAVNNIRNRTATAQAQLESTFYSPVVVTGERRLPKLFEDAYRVDIGVDYNYSKEDAYENLHRVKINMSDGSIAVSDEDGFSVESDLSWTSRDLGGASSATKLERSVDYMASRYVAMKERINTEFVGEQREINLQKLDEMMNQYKNSLAKEFSDGVGGVFEENGVSGEKEHLYQSILSELDSKVSQYSDYVKSNKNYADINGADEAWLARDSAYMASELRKSMAGTVTNQIKVDSKTDNYTLEEMEKMQAFANELVSYSKVDSNSSKNIMTGFESEESLGIKLAELNLKGKVFNEFSGVSTRIKDVVTKSIENFTEKAINKEQEFMTKWTDQQIEAQRKYLDSGEYSRTTFENEVAKIRQSFSAVDRNAVYDVINKVGDAYERTGNVSESIMEGAVFAINSYDKKVQSSNFKGVQRYTERSGSYWNNYFTNNDKHYGENAYLKKESGLENSINSWNSFMEKITTNGNAFFDKVQFSAKA